MSDAPDTTPDVAPDMARMNAAIALLEQEDAADTSGAPAPEAEPAAEQPPADPKPDTQEPKPDPAEPPKAAEPEAEKIPTLDELRAEVASRQQQRATPEPTKQGAVEAAQTKQEAAAIRSIPIDEFSRDPVGSLIAAGINPAQALRTLATATMGKQPPTQQAQPQAPKQEDIEKLVEQKLQQKWAEYEAKQIAEDQAATAREAEEAFSSLVDDAVKYQYASKLTAEERIWFGNQIADAEVAAGRTPTLERVALILETTLARRYAPPGSPGSGVNHQSAAGSDPTAPTGAATLTQSMPATAPKKAVPKTEEERLAAALAIAAAAD